MPVGAATMAFLCVSCWMRLRKVVFPVPAFPVRKTCRCVLFTYRAAIRAAFMASDFSFIIGVKVMYYQRDTSLTMIFPALFFSVTMAGSCCKMGIREDTFRLLTIASLFTVRHLYGPSDSKDFTSCSSSSSLLLPEWFSVC